MTEIEWTTGDDPDVLLDAAKAMKLLRVRKGRLFSNGCFRVVWDKITADDIKLAVEMSDARADKKISQQELERHRYPMTKASEFVRSWLAVAIQSLATSSLNPGHVAHQVRAATENSVFGFSRRGLPCRAQADLVREVVGNPFRPVTFDPRWRTSDVVGLAQAIYDDKAFERMPILADALMDAGCEEEQIISHCRGDGPHVRGCWVVDLVLGKT